jgi:hypothetical protein
VDLAFGLMEKWFCIWEFLANPKDNADLVPNRSARTSGCENLSHILQIIHTPKLTIVLLLQAIFLGRKLSLF